MEPLQTSQPARPSGGARTSTALSAVALLLAVAALAVNFVVPGPTGPAGPRGDRGATGTNGTVGPAGPGTLQSTAVTYAQATVGPACRSFPGYEVNITVPSSGTVVVRAQVWVQIYHNAGTSDAAILELATTPTECTDLPYEWQVDIPAGAASEWFVETAAPQRAFNVTAGTHTFYVDFMMAATSGGSEGLYAGNMVAVFYPS